MDPFTASAAAFVRKAFADLLAVADRVGEPGIGERPLGPDTTAIANLVAHCCGVTEFWFGHVALGRPTDRDRDAEFTSRPSLVDLHRLVDAAVARADADLADLGTRIGGPPLENDMRGFFPEGDTSDHALVLYVLRELYQHLGHAEITADALAAR
jgi:hypothetical protein